MPHPEDSYSCNKTGKIASEQLHIGQFFELDELEMPEFWFAERKLIDTTTSGTYPHRTIGGNSHGENNVIANAEWIIRIILV